MIRETLNGIWRMRRVGEDAAYPAAVPGSVLSTLLDAGAIEDPYYRDNEYAIRELFWNDYEFSRTFTVSAEQLSYEKTELVCHGLDTLAELFLNGTSVAATSDMHRTYRFEVGGLLHEGENEIRIVFSSVLRYIENYQPAKGKEITVIPAGGMRGNQYLRKAHSMFGWDWGAQLPDAGIWRDIELVCYGEARITDVRIRQRHENGTVTLRVETALEVLEAKNYKVSLTLSPSYFNGQKLPATEVLAKTAIVMAGSADIAMELTVEKPRLWWPNGLGDQNLYNLHVSLKPAGIAAGGAAALAITRTEPIDERDYTIGLRTLTVSQDEDEWGSEFCFRVNGVKLFSKGANYIPEDCVYSRITERRIDMLLSSAKRANYNTIRVWGGGYYPSDTFYELCDRYGLIVWQDLMYACNAYELTDELEENIIAETKDNAVRLRHHASLGLWCGNNEIESAWYHWPDFEHETPYVRADYIKMFEYILPRALREADDTTFYWPSSPSSGGSLDNPDDAGRGDTHYWAVWHGQLPFSDYQKHFFRFCSEFGFQSFPNGKTVDSYTLPEDRNIFSRVMEDHQKNDSANGKMLFYLSENFRYPKDFYSLLYVTQILQAVAVKSGVEHWRRNRGRCMGTLYWQINDNWPVASWASIDYYGRWKPLHYMAARFYAPTAGSLVRTDAGKENSCLIEAHCQNESAKSVPVSVELSLKTMTFDVLRTVRTEIVLEPFSAHCLLKEDYEDLLLQELRTSRPPERCVGGAPHHAAGNALRMQSGEVSSEASYRAVENALRMQSGEVSSEASCHAVENALRTQPGQPASGTPRHAREDVFAEAVFTFTDEKGRETKQYEQEVFLPYKYLRLPEVQVRAAVAERADKAAYEITLTADACALFVTLDFADADVIFSDNCISITGREPRVVTLEKKDILRGSFADAADVQKRLTVTSLRDTY